MADSDEASRQWEIMRWAACSRLEANPGYAGLVAEHFVKRMVPENGDLALFLFGKQSVLQDFFRAKFIATVHHGDMPGDVGKVEGFFHRGVAAANDAHVLALVEKTVTRRAAGNAFTHEGFFGRQPQILRRRARGDDQCVAGVGVRVAY